MSDIIPELSDFGGIVRLFPLPNLVLFPHLLQGLHIFEPRYREMTADALADNRLLAMVLLRNGWEAGYEGRPAVHEVACVGKIVMDQCLPDGRYNLQLRGLSRARILGEIEDDKPYRSAQVELLPDVELPSAGAEKKLRRQLRALIKVWSEGREQTQEMFTRLLKSDLELGVIGDVLSYALSVPTEFKQQLLAIPEVETRLRLLVEHLEQHQPEKLPMPQPVEKRPYPPDFSAN
jgi:Lon protease-like protein